MSSIIQEPQYGQDPLLDAVKKGDISEVRAHLAGRTSNQINQLYRSDNEVFNLLNYAAKCKPKLEIVTLLIEKGVKIISEGPTKNVSPLETAIEYGYTDIAKLLVKEEAPVDADLFYNTVQSGFEDVATEMFHRHGMTLLRKVTDDVHEKKRSFRTYRRKENTPFRELIRCMPKLAEKVLDKCVPAGAHADDHHDKEFEFGFVYELIDDFQDTIGNTDEIELMPKYKIQDAKLRFRNSWGPKTFSKHNHPLSIMVRHQRKELLNHPVVSALIHFKWRHFGLLSYALNLAFYIVFLTFLTSFALLLPNPQKADCFNLNSTICEETSYSTAAYLRGSAVIVFIISFIKLILEILQMISQGVFYFTDLSNWIEPALFICSMLFTIMSNWTCPCVLGWQWQVGAVALFLAWSDLILFTSKLPKIGIYVVMFVEICKTFVELSLLTVLLVITFGLAFFMIFSDPRVSRSTFGTGFRSLVRTFVMTTGELDYDGIFRLDASDPDNDGPELAFVYTAYALWVPFVIIMPVLFANLLTGLAVGDTTKVKEEAEFRQLSQQIDQILTIEQWVWFFRRCCGNRRIFNKFGTTFKPNRRKGYKEKSRRFYKFLTWKNEYDTLDAFEKIAKKQADEVTEKVKEELELFKDEMRKLIKGDGETETETPTTSALVSEV